MEFWLIIIGIIFVIGFFNKGEEKRPVVATTSSSSRRIAVQDDEYAGKFARWQRDLIDEVPVGRWIRSSEAADLVEMCPPPEWRGSEWISPVRNLTNQDIVKRELQRINQAFLDKQQTKLKEFFDTVEKNPLTGEQVHACVCMDDSVMVVAAAGSGKTSTMVAKAGYVLKEGMAKGGETLLLAFNNDAAKELGDRLKERLNDVPGSSEITAQTFHAFGLKVIGDVTGKKPSIAPWVANGEELKVLVEIVRHLIANDPGFSLEWHLFCTVFANTLKGGGPDAYRNGRKGYLTANGEVVKSEQERRIADWLFYHHVPYQYEREYEVDTADPTHAQYRPDFYYPNVDLYHEHFAIDGDGVSNFGRGYAESAEWKRALHKEHGTSLFETASHEMEDDTWLVRLEQELRSRGQKMTYNSKRRGDGSKPIPGNALVGVLSVFHKHVKSNGLTREDLVRNLEKMSKASGDRLRCKLFMSIYSKASDALEGKLKEGDYIDFEDMLIQASELIESGSFTNPYKVVLADEYQDSSRIRVRMLKALTQQPGRKAHLCVVGDDWQGINRFAGADISVMTDFGLIFRNSTRLNLGRTFRFPAQTCELSSKFIQKNSRQIHKLVTTTNVMKFSEGSVVISGFDDISKMSSHVGNFLLGLHERFAGEAPISVMLLGRYNDDRPVELERWKREFGNVLDISFRTVHASKGLEADYVVLLSVVEGKRGFPSGLNDDPVLQMALPEPDPFPDAEERRLFYVALTRARRQTFIYTSLKTPSRFVTELASIGKLNVVPVDGNAFEACPKCQQGIMKLRSGKRGEFWGCSAFPKCNFTRSASEKRGGFQTAPRRRW